MWVSWMLREGGKCQPQALLLGKIVPRPILHTPKSVSSVEAKTR